MISTYRVCCADEKAKENIGVDVVHPIAIIYPAVHNISISKDQVTSDKKKHVLHIAQFNACRVFFDFITQLGPNFLYKLKDNL